MADDAGDDTPSVEARIRALEQRVASLEGELAARTPVRRLRPPPPPPSSGPAPAAPPPPPPTGASLGDSGPMRPAVAAPPRPTPAWTTGITTEVALKWAGLVLLFLAAVFLVSTAISRGWIGPELQLLGAVALGAALVGFGLRPALRHRGWGTSFVSVGVAVWFIACGAPSQWLDLGGVGKGMLAAFVVAAIGVGLSRFVDSRLVAFSTFFGLAVVAVWIEAFDEFGAPAFLFGVVVAVAVFFLLHLDRDWPSLYVGVAATTALLGFVPAFEDEAHGLVQALLVALALLYWLTPAAHARLWPEADHRSAAQLGGRLQLATPAWMWGVTMILHDFDADHAGVLVGTAIAVVGAASSQLLRPIVPKWLWVSQLLGCWVVLSLGLISWLDGSTLLAALAAQAAAMLALSIAIDDRWFTYQSVATATVVWLATLGLTLEALERDAAWGADVVHGLVFVVTLGIGWALRSRSEGRLLALVGYGGGLLWVASAFVHLGQGQLIVSAVWAAIGAFVVVWGLGRGRVSEARVGLATLALTVVKLLTVDLAEVDTFWRAGLFFVIGLGLLWLSASIPKLADAGRSPADEPATGDGQPANNNQSPATE